MITPANIAGNNHNVLRRLLWGLSGKCAGDNGCQSALFEAFCERGMQLLVRSRRGMRHLPVPGMDVALLRHRPLIESVNDILATMCEVEHSRHHRFILWHCQRGGSDDCLPVLAGKTAHLHTRRGKLPSTSRINPAKSLKITPPNPRFRLNERKSR